MGKLKLSKSDFDVDELDVEWSESDYQDYTGKQPPTGTVLRGGIQKMWWTYTANDDPMIKMLWVAAGNTGETAEYNGLPVWDNIVFTPKAAFKYGPFLQVLGLTLKQIQTQLFVADDDDNVGAPIEKIGKVAPSTSATECGIVTKRRKWNDEWQVNIGKLIEQPEADDEEDEEEEAPKRSRRAVATKPASARRKPEPEPEEDDDLEEEVDDDDVEDEPEEKPARRAPAKAAAKPATRSRRKPADDDDDDDEPF